MKRKILAIALAVSLLAIAVVSGTLAYFADTEYAINVLTSGNVEIVLHEDNDNGLLDDEYRDWLEAQKFHPGVSLEKDVWVENTGSNEAYIRLFIAYPYDAQDVMTLTFDTMAEWTDDVTGYDFINDVTEYSDVNDKLDGEGYYTTYIGSEKFIVRCLTLVDPLAPDAKTSDTLTKITMVPETEWKYQSNKIAYYNDTVRYANNPGTYPADYELVYVSENGQIPVYICAQAVQVVKNENEDFTVTEAFNAAFGAYDQAWWISAVVVEGTQTLTGAINSTGVAVTVDKPATVNIDEAIVNADQLAVYNADATLQITDSEIHVEKGVNLNNSNTTILLDNVHFYVADGPVVYGSMGGQVVYILNPIYINGVEFDFSAEMKDTYFPNCIVLR